MDHPSCLQTLTSVGCTIPSRLLQTELRNYGLGLSSHGRIISLIPCTHENCWRNLVLCPWMCTFLCLLTWKTQYPSPSPSKKMSLASDVRTRSQRIFLLQLVKLVSTQTLSLHIQVELMLGSIKDKIPDCGQQRKASFHRVITLLSDIHHLRHSKFKGSDDFSYVRLASLTIASTAEAFVTCQRAARLHTSNLFPWR